MGDWAKSCGVDDFSVWFAGKVEVDVLSDEFGLLEVQPVIRAVNTIAITTDKV